MIPMVNACTAKTCFMFKKNLLLFYLSLIIPFGLIILFVKFDYIDANVFVLLLAIYFFVYRPLICALRLFQNQKISKRDFWKNFIPFWNDKYWVFLFFNR